MGFAPPGCGGRCAASRLGPPQRIRSAQRLVQCLTAERVVRAAHRSFPLVNVSLLPITLPDRPIRHEPRPSAPRI